MGECLFEGILCFLACPEPKEKENGLAILWSSVGYDTRVLELNLGIFKETIAWFLVVISSFAEKPQKRQALRTFDTIETLVPRGSPEKKSTIKPMMPEQRSGVVDASRNPGMISL